MSAIRYSEFAPHPSLSSYVLGYWEYAAGSDIDPFEQHVMPDGCLVLACGLSQGAVWERIVGPSLTGFHAPIHPGDIIRGIRFWPDAGGTLLDLDPVELRDCHVPVENAPDGRAPTIRRAANASVSPEEAAAIFDSILVPFIDAAEPIDRIVRECVRMITSNGGRIAISDVADRIGMSERQLQRRFRRAAGITPKQYARIRRLRNSVGAALDDADPSWSRLAAEQGYADQAHLIREFSQLTGHSPVTFMQRTSRIKHVNVNP